MRLSELKNGENGIILGIRGSGAFRKRITEMGFVNGKVVTVIKNAPLKDPIVYNLLGYNISLRRTEAHQIEVLMPGESIESEQASFHGVVGSNLVKQTPGQKQKTIHVALVGNPNSGKTTLFNHASRSREHVGNYSGVTVDSKTATFRQGGYTFEITDLPGTYSLSAYSPEEVYVRDFLLNQKPDVVINVVDASNLERNLYLTTQLIDLDIKVIVALNMYDDLQKRGDEFDYVALGKLLGMPFVPTVASKGRGVKELFEKVINVYNDLDPIVRHIHINYGAEVEYSIAALEEELQKEPDTPVEGQIHWRLIALKLLEKDNHIKAYILNAKNYSEIVEVVRRETSRLEAEYKSDTETVIADARYGFIAGALKETFKAGVVSRKQITESIDHLLTHKLFGFPFFFLFLWVMFTATFRLGEYPMHWLEQFVGFTGGLFERFMPEGSFKDLLIDGIIGGVGSVLVFLPNIVILFFFISLMEDTGYMARVAFIMDKVMHKIGLHGKSFIPLIMGFGCNVPAIMSTRTIENRNNRLVTMLITPFMSCSARLPVYILIIGAFFSRYQSVILFAIYLIGVAMAVLAALLLNRIFFSKSEEAPFVMELPPYRVPTMRSTIRHMWHKSSEYLKKMGGIIMVAAIIIWSLGYFPVNNRDTALLHHDKDSLSVVNQKNLTMITDTLEAASIEVGQDRVLLNFQTESSARGLEASYIGRIGHFIEPVIRPLGFDWKIGVGLLTGIAAKEVVISTLAVMYHAGEAGTDEQITLTSRLRSSVHESGKRMGEPVYTIPVVWAVILFILIYFPCVAVVAAVSRESGSWKWALFTVFYSTALAWLVAFATFQVLNLFY